MGFAGRRNTLFPHDAHDAPERPPCQQNKPWGESRKPLRSGASSLVKGKAFGGGKDNRSNLTSVLEVREKTQTFQEHRWRDWEPAKGHREAKDSKKKGPWSPAGSGKARTSRATYVSTRGMEGRTHLPTHHRHIGHGGLLKGRALLGIVGRSCRHFFFLFLSGFGLVGS
jgi:hypothetical protein